MRNFLMILSFFVALLISTPYVAAQEKTKEPAQLIKNLNSDDYETREDSTYALIKLSLKDENVFGLVKKTYKETKNPEVKGRVNFIINKVYELKKEARPKEEALQEKRPLEPKSPPQRTSSPFDVLKDFDFEKILGDDGINETIKGLGLTKEMQDLVKKALSGEELSPEKMLKDFFNGSFGQQENKPKENKEFKINPKKVFGILWTNSPEGIKVHEVLEGSYAEEIGIKAGDTLVSLNGKKFKEAKGIRVKGLIPLSKPMLKRELVVLRESQEVTLKPKKMWTPTSKKQ